jgi:hypothetical protein
MARTCHYHQIELNQTGQFIMVMRNMAAQERMPEHGFRGIVNRRAHVDQFTGNGQYLSIIFAPIKYQKHSLSQAVVETHLNH